MTELDKVREQWARLFSPASYRQQDCWLYDWMDALKQAPYLRIQPGKGSSLFSLISLTCHLKFPGMSMYGVKADITRMWCDFVAAGTTEHHSVMDTPEGFEFFFTALTPENTFITGTISVKKKA